jgi:glycosyltransferase involved in cell wall biosynthesis
LTIISQQDKDNFEFEKAKEIHVINNGIDQSFFENLNINKTFDLVFVGNMSYLPNIEAAEYLASKILPLCPVNTSLLIAGANPADRIKKLADENVTISGWMDDIRLAYGQARVFVAPLWSGTGQQNKILEAMAMGIPSITTTAVNNAINAQENKEIMIANDEIEFVNHINILLSNKDKYHDISHNAKTFVARNFDWNHNGLILSSIFAQNLKAHGS